MRVAVLSDTHGNLTAFTAVLADIERHHVDQVIHLGDVAGKGPRGSACCALARERCQTVIRGNWDVFILKDPIRQSPALRWWHAELTPHDRSWLANLPFSLDLVIGGTRIRCFHASSDDVFHRIYPSMDDDTFAAQFINTPATGDGPLPTVAIYGDIHHAYSRIEGEYVVLNVGSVGNPLDEPVPSYVLLDDDIGELRWRTYRVPYDIEAELAVASALDMPEYDAWAQELRTAIYART
jgi:protein phosphatase